MCEIWALIGGIENSWKKNEGFCEKELDEFAKVNEVALLMSQLRFLRRGDEMRAQGKH